MIDSVAAVFVQDLRESLDLQERREDPDRRDFLAVRVTSVPPGRLVSEGSRASPEQPGHRVRRSDSASFMYSQTAPI